MLEIVFSQSACGSLKQARGYGRGAFPGCGAVQLFVSGEECISEAEQLAALRQAEESARQDWENAVPLELDPQDVYCFDLSLSIGSLADGGLGSVRKAVLQELLSVWDASMAIDQAEAAVNRAAKTLIRLQEAYQAGQALRIWYSGHPDELCGLHWLLAQLQPLHSTAPIYLVELPIRERASSWGGAAPGDYGRYASLQVPLSPTLLEVCAKRWQRLSQENAPLRVNLNGRLQSTGIDFYDSFLLRAIDEQPETFSLAGLIVRLAQTKPGLSVEWLTLRTEQLIDRGILEPLEDTPRDAPRYRKKLRKIAPQEDT